MSMDICAVCKSLPNVLFSSKSNRMLSLHTSKSLSSCFKVVQDQSQYYKKKNKINPTIGDLLGDDDLFHSHYHNQYSSSRFKRKQYHSHIHPYHGHRKPRRSNYFHTIKDSQSIPESNQVYLYPATYSYTPLPSCCYYCYSNMTPCCPYLVSDYYTGLYQQEICYETSTSYHDYQRTENYKYSDYHHIYDKKTR